MYAPIALFVYNRPSHTIKVLDALANNAESGQSDLYIFCDGPKKDSSTADLQKIEEVRKIVRAEKRFKTIQVKAQEDNLGLANSIIAGVTDVINKHERIIVVEDDILAATGFLKYMNDALNLYADEDKAGCIHAWNYTLDVSEISDTTFFLKGGDCWGWATWKRSWKLFNPNGKYLLEQILSKDLLYEFNRRNTHPFGEMLRNQIEGKNDSWAIRWHASLFLSNKYCLQPREAIVKNIGLDNSGTHCGNFFYNQEVVNHIPLRKIIIEEADWFFKAYTIFDKKIDQRNKWQLLKSYLKRLLRL